jgi:hypothetical protein
MTVRTTPAAIVAHRLFNKASIPLLPHADRGQNRRLILYQANARDEMRA